MSKEILEELSKRARKLVARDGKSLEFGVFALMDDAPDEAEDRELRLKGYTFNVDHRGTLVVEDISKMKTLYMEDPSGRPIQHSPPDILEPVLEILREHMVLDDLAEI